MAASARGAVTMLMQPAYVDMGGTALVEFFLNDQSAIDGIYIFFDGDRQEFILRRVEGTDYDEVSIPAGAFVAGQEITVGAKWTDAILSIAKTGDTAFTSAASTRIPQGTMGNIKFGAE